MGLYFLESPHRVTQTSNSTRTGGRLRGGILVQGVMLFNNPAKAGSVDNFKGFFFAREKYQSPLFDSLDQFPGVFPV